MPPRDLIKRTELFGLAVTRFLRTLPKTDEAKDTARQLRRAANSTRANYRAARKGRSRKVFEDKLAVASEEADECVGWLEYLRDAGIATNTALIAESREISAILSVSENGQEELESYEDAAKELVPLPTYFPL